LKEFIAKHLFERNFYYNQAKYTVIVDDKNSDEIASEIHTLIK
jgi:shikimate kinase